MPKGFVDDRDDTLIAMYGYFLTTESGPKVSVSQFKRTAALLLSTSYLASLLESLTKLDFLEADIGEYDDDIYTMTEEGVIQAEQMVVERGLSLDEFEASFAKRLNSGLIVDIQHGQLDDAIAALDALSEHLKTDNDIGSISGDERDVAILEVAQLKESMQQPRIRTSYLWTKANEVLIWITEKGAGAAVGELAKSALKHIHSFINVFFN